MKSIISVGSINADFHMRVPKSLSGTEVAKNFMRVPGGKAANVAVFARRIGTDVRLVGCIGPDDLAAQALEGPRASGVNIDEVCLSQEPTGIAIVLVRPGGGNQSCWPPALTRRGRAEPVQQRW